MQSQVELKVDFFCLNLFLSRILLVFYVNYLLIIQNILHLAILNRSKYAILRSINIKMRTINPLNRVYFLGIYKQNRQL
jgi:hypothetical protein